MSTFFWIVIAAVILFCDCFHGQRCNCKHGNSCEIKDHWIEVKKDNCQVRHVRVKKCGGCCLSHTVPAKRANHKGNLFESKAECCSVVESEEINETLECLDGPKVVSFRSATRCLCSLCRGFP